MWPNKRPSKFYFLICCSLFFPVAGFAADTVAVDFSKQAGVITGAAQACGENVTTMTMRSDEVISTLAANPTDKTYAVAAFEQARQQGYNNVTQSHQAACAKIVSDFSSLPLLQPNYQETVIQPLSGQKSSSSPATATATPPAPAVVPPTAVLPSQANPTPPPVAQGYVSALPPAPNPAAVVPMNPAAAGRNPATGASVQPQTSAEVQMQQLQLVQQVAQMTQTLIAAGQGSVMPPAGVPNGQAVINGYTNSTVSTSPIFSGGTLPPPGSGAAAQQ